MATAPAMRSFGTTLKIGTQLIGGWRTSSSPGTDTNFIESTAQDTAGGFKTYLSGLHDGGTFPIEGVFSPDDAGQAALIAAFGDESAFTITYVDGSAHTFNAIVGAVTTVIALDGTLDFTSSHKVTGAVTFTPAA